jgi:hypothetical protein
MELRLAMLTRQPEMDLLYAPDLLVLIAIAVAGIEAVLVPAVCVDVLFRHEMDFGDVPAWLLTVKGAIEFVDRLPTVQVERFRHGADLVLAFANALIRGCAAVAGRDQCGLASGATLLERSVGTEKSKYRSLKAST